MSIASRIQEIETHIGDVYDTINYSYDTTGVNKNIINIPKYLKKGYIDIINNGIDNLYNNFPKVSGIGSNLSLTPTYEAPMKLNEIQGNTLQENTPTPDTPVPIECVTGLQKVNVCGKNLLNNNVPSLKASTVTWTPTSTGGTLTNTATWGDGIQWHIELDTTKTYTFKANGLPSNLFCFMEICTDNTYSSIETRIIRDKTGNILETFQPTKKYLRIRFLNSSAISNVDISNLQLEIGSSSTSYEPYKGNTYEVNLGKNLWGISNQTTTKNNVDITIQDGEITLNGTASGDGLIMFNPIDETILNGDYTLNEIYVSGTYTGNASNINVRKKGTSVNIKSLNYAASNTNITLNVSNTSIIFGIYLTNGSSFTNFKFKPQLVKGTSADYNFSPYFTPIELNKIGDYQDSIKKSTGKNLNNGTMEEGSISGENGENIPATNRIRTIDYINVNSSTQYTLNAFTKSNKNIQGFIFEYDENNVFIQRTPSSWQQVPITFTTSSITKKIRILLSYTDTSTTTVSDFYNIMLNEGSTALPYEPYGKVWYVEKQIGKVVLDGSENWATQSVSTGYSRYSTSINTNTPYNNGYNNRFTQRVTQAHGSYEYLWLQPNTGYLYLQLLSNRLSEVNLNGFKTWLASNNVEFIYILSTPTITEITNEELINQLEALNTAKSQEGTTNISITSEDLEMILNVSVLKGEE